MKAVCMWPVLLVYQKSKDDGIDFNREAGTKRFTPPVTQHAQYQEIFMLIVAHVLLSCAMCMNSNCVSSSYLLQVVHLRLHDG